MIWNLPYAIDPGSAAPQELLVRSNFTWVLQETHWKWFAGSFPRGLHSSLYFSLLRAWHQSCRLFRSEDTSLLHTGQHIGTKEQLGSNIPVLYPQPPTNAQFLFLVMHTDTFTG